MKASHIFSSILISAMLLSCQGYKDKEQQTLEDITKHELITALAERDELLSLVKEVSDGLEQIKQLESSMSVAATDSRQNQGQRVRILSDITNLKETLKHRKDQLQRLEAKLDGSTINNKELHETVGALHIQIDSQLEVIESLKGQLTAANERIGLLNNTVDSLSTTVSTVSVERDAAQEAAIGFENQLNTCYYIVANKSELKSHDIIESGFLRRTKVMKGNFDKSYFLIGDKRSLDALPLNAPKAKILTNHPESSYTIVDIDGEKVLKIIYPQQFWSLTNYLVVQID